MRSHAENITAAKATNEPHDGSPNRNSEKDVGGLRSEHAAAAHAAERADETAALAALQQDDEDQEQRKENEENKQKRLKDGNKHLLKTRRRLCARPLRRKRVGATAD